VGFIIVKVKFPFIFYNLINVIIPQYYKKLDYYDLAPLTDLVYLRIKIFDCFEKY